MFSRKSAYKCHKRVFRTVAVVLCGERTVHFSCLVGLILTVGGTATAGSPACVAGCDFIEDENDDIPSDQEIHHSQSENR